MPIQFRCQYCRQRLGIADSRAGALVDCPACGRSLRVPNGSGETGPATDPSDPIPTSDRLLHSALQQLSEIGSDVPSQSTATPVAHTAKVVPRKATTSTITAANAVRAGSVKGSANAPDPLKELASLPAATSHDIPVLAEPELLDDVGGDEELSAKSADPPATETSASDTGATANAAHAPLAAALAELAVESLPMAATPPRSRLRRAFPFCIPVLSGLLMFCAGYLAARSTSQHQQTTETQAAAAAGKSISPESSAASQPVVIGMISGVVEAADANGKPVPDAGALVIVAPAANPSDLRIDGRFLRDPPNSSGRLAITAALGQLGLHFTNAAADGSYSLPLPATGPFILIAVSRRNARPASATLPAETAARLNEWFTSPSPVTGRLQTLVQTVTAPGNGEGVRQNLTIPAM